jgi:hypothetical protein
MRNFMTLNSAETITATSNAAKGSQMATVVRSRRSSKTVANIMSLPHVAAIFTEMCGDLDLLPDQTEYYALKWGVTINGRPWKQGTGCEFLYKGKTRVGKVDLFYHAVIPHDENAEDEDDHIDPLIVQISVFRIVSEYRSLRTVRFRRTRVVTIPVHQLTWMLSIAPHLEGDDELRELLRVGPTQYA